MAEGQGRGEAYLDFCIMFMCYLITRMNKLKINWWPDFL